MTPWAVLFRRSLSLFRFLASAVRLSLRRPLFCLPVVLWLSLFTVGISLIPNELKPRISTQLFPRLESTLLYPHRWFRVENPPIILDLVAAIPYTFHFILPFAFIACLWAKSAHPLRVLKFGMCLGILNVSAVIIQILFPVAPPWYFEKYGFDGANYGMAGDPGGLARIDAYFGSKHYYNIYSHAPIVFGAFPSLHSAWPFLLAVFEIKRGHRIRYFMFHSAWVWWAALYLEHHFLLDIVGGAALAGMVYRIFGRVTEAEEEGDALPLPLYSREVNEGDAGDK